MAGDLPETETTQREPEAAARPAPDPIALQLAGFEDRVTRKLADVADKVDAVAQTLAAPVAPDAPAIAAGALPPAAAPEGDGTGLLSGIAQTVKDLEHKAAEAVRSLASTREDDAYPDNGVSSPALRTETAPVGPHTQAIAERREQAAEMAL